MLRGCISHMILFDIFAIKKTHVLIAAVVMSNDTVNF